MPNRRTLLKGMAASAGFTLLPFGTNVSAVAHEPSPEMVFDDPAAPVLGNPDGDVTVVEYFDVQCGYCKRDYPMMRDVVARDGGVKLVMKDWPIFGPVSVFAAQAMQAAAELGEYETALDALMRSQGRLSHEQIEGILTGAGLDLIWARSRQPWFETKRKFRICSIAITTRQKPSSSLARHLSSLARPSIPAF